MLYKTPKHMLGIALTFLIGVVLFKNYIANRNILYVAFSILVILIFTIVLYILISKAKPTTIDNRKKWIRNIVIANCILLAIQVFVTCNLYFTPGYDGQYIMESSTAVAQGADALEYVEYYYSFFYINSFIFSIQVWLKKVALLFEIQNLQLFVSLVTNIFTNISCFFMALCLERFTKKRVLIDFGWFLYAFFIVLSPWALEIYTNAYSLLFPVVTLYMFLSRNDQPKYHTAKIIVMVAMATIGYWMKVTNVIVLIAIVIYEVINKLKTKKLFRIDTIKQGLLAIGIVGFASLLVTLSCYMTRDEHSAFFDDRNVPVTHYFMVGLNKETTGFFSESDNTFIHTFSTKAEMEEANIEVSRQRLEEFGLVGYVQFLGKKLSYNYFYFGMPNTQTAVLSEPSAIRNLVVEFYLSSNDAFYQQICRCLWLCILLFLFFSCFPKYDDEYFVVLLTIFGITIFLLLFETGSRQLFLFGSFYCIAAMVGFDRVYENVKKRIKLKQEVHSQKPLL